MWGRAADVAITDEAAKADTVSGECQRFPSRRVAANRSRGWAPALAPGRRRLRAARFVASSFQWAAHRYCAQAR